MGEEFEKIRRENAPLSKNIFYSVYANIPNCMRDKSCGLSWTDVYELLSDN